MSFSKHGRFSAETGQELDAIDPKASSNNKSSKVLSASNICHNFFAVSTRVGEALLNYRRSKLTKFKCIASLFAPPLAKELR